MIIHLQSEKQKVEAALTALSGRWCAHSIVNLHPVKSLKGSNCFGELIESSPWNHPFRGNRSSFHRPIYGSDITVATYEGRIPSV